MRAVLKIEIAGSIEVNEKVIMRIMFIFQEHATEVVNIEKNEWLKILEEVKKEAQAISWNELKKRIYHSVVFNAHERISEFNV